LIFAAVAGVIGGGIVILVTKSDLERDLSRSGDELQRQLRRSGSTLRRQLEAASREAATEAVRAEMRRLGVTDSLVRDTATTVRRLNAIAARFT
jgi:hypothetical protein